MNSTVINQLETYKAIEAVCVKNYSVWTHVQTLRGAFSRFALRVAQLDMISENPQTASQPRFDQLIREIETILKQSFDHFFDYLAQRNSEISRSYQRVRKN